MGWVCNIIWFRDYKHHQNLHEYSYNRVIHSPSLLSTMLISPRKSDSFRRTLSNSSRTGFEPIRWFLNVITWFQIFWPGIIHVHLKKWNVMKKANIFCHSFQKVKPIYYIDSLHIEWNISSLYFLKFGWLWLTYNENPKFNVSENLNIT